MLCLFSTGISLQFKKKSEKNSWELRKWRTKENFQSKQKHAQRRGKTHFFKKMSPSSDFSAFSRLFFFLIIRNIVLKKILLPILRIFTEKTGPNSLFSFKNEMSRPAGAGLFFSPQPPGNECCPETFSPYFFLENVLLDSGYIPRNLNIQTYCKWDTVFKGVRRIAFHGCPSKQ